MKSSYSIPQNMRVYAIGDIHGYAKELYAMHDLIREDLDSNPVDNVQIVYIGDYVDRGPENNEVIQCLIERELNEPDIQHTFLLGNHENAMMEFMNDPLGARKDWLDWGGINTLMSYGVQPEMSKPLGPQAAELAEALVEAMPLSHHEFLKNCQLYHEIGDYLFVHAGIKPNVPMNKQKQFDLTMIRTGFLDSDVMHDKRVVHGHTSVKKMDVRPNRINVDSGLYYGRHLTAGVLEGTGVRALTVDMIDQNRSRDDGRGG